MPRRPGGRALAALLAAVALAGCSGSGRRQPLPLPGLGVSSNGEQDKTGAEVLTDARRALLAAPGVHAVGALAVGGQALQVDLVLTREGVVSGSVTSAGLRAQVVRSAAGRVLVRGAPELAILLGVPAGPAAAGDDRYHLASGPAGGGASGDPGGAVGPVEALALPALADRLLGPGAPEQPTTAGQGGVPDPAVSPGDADGARSVVVTVAGARVWVAATGTPWPQRVAGGATVPGVLELGDYEALPSPAAVPSGSAATADGGEPGPTATP